MTQPVEAVVFDWGGTLTPWHTVDLPEQWRVFAREVHGIPVESPDVSDADLEEAHRLADRILEAESAAWARGRAEHTSAALADILVEAGVDAAHDRHHLALAAYRGFWEPHTLTDPQVRPLWEGLHARGIKVGVLSNTIWSREYHRDIFERDGVLDLLDADLYSSEIDHVKPHPEAFRAICRELDVAPAAGGLRRRPGVRGRARAAAGGHARHLDPALRHPGRPAGGGHRHARRPRPPAARRARHRRRLGRGVLSTP